MNTDITHKCKQMYMSIEGQYIFTGKKRKLQGNDSQLLILPYLFRRIFNNETYDSSSIGMAKYTHLLSKRNGRILKNFVKEPRKLNGYTDFPFR
jgi:hypothetical protein